MNLSVIYPLACAALIGVTAHASNPFIDAQIDLIPANSLTNLIDGDPSTIYTSQTALQAGDAIELSLPKVLADDSIVAVKTGRVDPNDMFEYVEAFKGGVLEYSKDGETWTEAGRLNCEYIAGTIPAGHSKLRLRATEDLNHKITLTELSIADRPPVISETQTVSFRDTDYELTVNVQLAGAWDLESELRELMEMYFELWGPLIDMLGSPVDGTHKHLNIIMRSDIPYPAFAHESGTVVIHTQHLQNKRSDAYGLFVHELTHIIQRYPTYIPPWFVEGAADYTRYKLYYDADWGAKFVNSVKNRNPLGYYSATAGFLLYLEDTYKKDIMRPVSIAVREDTYTEELWKKLTGKSLAELCVEYMKNDKWVPTTEHTVETACGTCHGHVNDLQAQFASLVR